MSDLETVKRAIAALPEPQQRDVLAYVRSLVPPHPIEAKLLASAEGLLEALARAPELTIRMIRGVIAEAAFAAEVIPTFAGAWTERPIGGDLPYDFLMTDQPAPAGAPAVRPGVDVRVQVKMQRSVQQRPLRASEQWKTLVRWPDDYFVVEMQRTRKGERGGVSTRPYRFGEFDVLAVSLGPARGRWSAFLYTLERWLLPDPADPAQVLTFQPVAPAPNADWTDDFPTAVAWWRAETASQPGARKRIAGDVPRRPPPPAEPLA